MKNWDQYFRDYVRGKLSRDQIREIEKAALDDDFLFDAWDGFYQHPFSVHEANLEKLDKRIPRPNAVKPFSIAKWIPWMAAASILAVTSVVLFLPDNMQETPQMASNTILEEPTETREEIGKLATEEIVAMSIPEEKVTQPRAPKGYNPNIVEFHKEEEGLKTISDELITMSTFEEQVSANNTDVWAVIDQVESVANSPSSQHHSSLLVEFLEFEKINDSIYVFTARPYPEQVELVKSEIRSSISEDKNLINEIVFNRDMTEIKFIAIAEAKDFSDLKSDVIIKSLVNYDWTFKMSSINGNPTIGQEAYLKFINANTILTKEWFFMRGLRKQYEVEALLSINADGTVHNVNILKTNGSTEMDEEILRLLQLDVKWETIDPDIPVKVILILK